jgi:hypothetical protein
MRQERNSKNRFYLCSCPVFVIDVAGPPLWKRESREDFFIMRGNGCHDLLPFLKSSECGSFKINRLPSFFAGSQEKVIQEAIEGTR